MYSHWSTSSRSIPVRWKPYETITMVYIWTQYQITWFSMFENFPNYVQNVLEEHPYSFLKELQKRHYKQRHRPSFFAELICYTLLLSYTYKQANKLLLEKFPLSSFSILEKIQRGGIESITAVKPLLEKGHLCQDYVFMVDEMYLQRGIQFHSGEYINANEDDELPLEIRVFIINALINTIPLVTK